MTILVACSEPVQKPEIVQLRKEVAALREELRQARLERDKQAIAAASLAKALERSNSELTQARRELASMRSSAPTQPRKLPEFPAKLDGIVLAVNDKMLVEISIGSEDGVREGQELDVFRETKEERTHVARIVIRRVRPERAVGEVLRDFKKGSIQVNDRVLAPLEK